MNPIDFFGANKVYDKPLNMSDEECMSGIPAEVGRDSQGFNYICTAWKPSYEDLQSLNKGEPIYIKILSTNFHPMAVWTLNEEYMPNDAD